MPTSDRSDHSVGERTNHRKKTMNDQSVCLYVTCVNNWENARARLQNTIPKVREIETDDKRLVTKEIEWSLLQKINPIHLFNFNLQFNFKSFISVRY